MIFHDLVSDNTFAVSEQVDAHESPNNGNASTTDRDKPARLSAAESHAALKALGTPEIGANDRFAPAVF